MKDRAALFQAIISKFVSERDECVLGINEIILSEYSEDTINELCCLFAQLNKVSSQIETVQQFYQNILNLEKIKKEEEK